MRWYERPQEGAHETDVMAELELFVLVEVELDRASVMSADVALLEFVALFAELEAVFEAEGRARSVVERRELS